MNEQSGSRGEANFVWKCKNCKVGSAIHSDYVMGGPMLISWFLGDVARVQCHYQNLPGILRTDRSGKGEKHYSD